MSGEGHMTATAKTGRAGVLAAALMACVANAGIASAHPHIWIIADYQVETGGDGKISAIAVDWTFDEFFSSYMVDGLDANSDGKVEGAELDEIARQNMESLKEVGYFVFPKADGEKVGTGDPEIFQYAYEGGFLRLRFTLPLAEPIDPRTHAFSFAVYDPSYYTEIKIPEGKNIAAPEGCTSVIVVPTMDFSTLTGVTEQDWSDPNRFEGMGKMFAQSVSLTCGAS
jgi:ABC-type uncharacterized transport system substrate-binding protein